MKRLAIVTFSRLVCKLRSVTDGVPDPLYEAFGKLVHQHRKRVDRMTQDRLGALVGLSRTSITNIEKGRQHVSLHQLYRIADALGVTPDLLLPVPPKPGTSKLAQKLPPGTDPEITQWAATLKPRKAKPETA